MRRHGGIATLALALLCLPRAALAQQEAASDALYRDALQSIAEGRKTDAVETLNRLIENEPLHAGAWLEVALLQCGLGNAAEAERLFDAIQARFNPPPGILELIADAREHGCDRWQLHRSATLTLGRGAEQNVNQGASTPNYVVHGETGSIELPLLPDFLPKHDQYTQLAGAYARDLDANGTVGFVQFHIRRNDDLRQYDSAALFAGIESTTRLAGWSVRGTGLVGATRLGGQYYQRQAEVQARVTPPLALPWKTQFSLLAGVTRYEYLTLTNFNSNTAELRGQLNYADAGQTASTSFALLDDRASTQRPGGSRHGWLANLNVKRRIGESASGEVAYTQQRWQSQKSYSPGLIEETRAQATQVLRGALSYALNPNHSLVLEARLVRNKENISVFQYNNRLLQLSWQWNGGQ